MAHAINIMILPILSTGYWPNSEHYCSARALFMILRMNSYQLLKEQVTNSLVDRKVGVHFADCEIKPLDNVDIEE